MDPDAAYKRLTDAYREARLAGDRQRRRRPARVDRAQRRPARGTQCPIDRPPLSRPHTRRREPKHHREDQPPMSLTYTRRALAMAIDDARYLARKNGRNAWTVATESDPDVFENIDRQDYPFDRTVKGGWHHAGSFSSLGRLPDFV